MKCNSYVTFKWFGSALNTHYVGIYSFLFPVERKAIFKLFRSMASQPSPEKASTTLKKLSLPFDASTRNFGVTGNQTQKRKITLDDARHKINPNLLTARGRGDLIYVAQRRTEFDIAPDWRAPMRSVVPMTQITRGAPTKERLPRLTNHVCLHNQREFVIHPEWIIHWS